MPVKACKKGGKPGYKYGNSGTCYTYNAGNESSRKRAKQRAEAQGFAIREDRKGSRRRTRRY